MTSATKEVIELGYADPKRIGIQGHSWGGYQTSYIATQTDMFACVVTGAPPTNLVSFYNELYKSTGTNQSAITEKGQVRMGVSPWDDMKLYEDQSAIFNAAEDQDPDSHPPRDRRRRRRLAPGSRALQRRPAPGQADHPPLLPRTSTIT